MKKRIYSYCYFLLFTVLLSFSVTPALYADTGDIGVGVGAGTLGVKADITIGISSRFNARIGYNGYSFDGDGTESDVTYDYEINLLSFPLLLDWHPFKDDGFRISAGVLINQNEVNMGATLQDTYDIGGTTYTASQIGKLSGTMDFDTLAPYVGFGWGNAIGKNTGWSFACDFGVVYQGEPNIELKADGIMASNPIFIQNLERERQDLEKEVKDYKYYPLITFGITYKF